MSVSDRSPSSRLASLPLSREFVLSIEGVTVRFTVSVEWQGRAVAEDDCYHYLALSNLRAERITPVDVEEAR